MAASLRAYYDGSTSYDRKGRRKSITLAGYVADPDCWARFETLWQAALAGDGTRPSCQHLHMTDARALRGEFSPANGWSVAKVRALLKDVVNLCFGPVGWGEHGSVFTGAACTVDLEDYSRACAALPVLEAKEPEAICVDFVVTVALLRLPQDRNGLMGKAGSVELFFDRGEPYRHMVDRIWRGSPLHKRSAVMRLISDVGIARPCSPALQAADYLAWHTSRHFGQQDLEAGVRRVLSAPSYSQRYDYAKLIDRFRAWGPETGYVRQRGRPGTDADN